MKNKAEIINRIIQENNYTDYLELGYHDGENFNKIECENKISVDINGKADFNDGDLAFFEQNENTFDCVFIDSLHECEHVRKVISESLKCLSEDGVIILHDTIPHSKEMQEVPRNTKEWTGNVYKAVVGFRMKYPNIKLETYRSDYGLSVLYPNGKKVKSHFEKIELSYEEFKSNEVELINIVD